jgi:argininosuccinate lyase
MKLWDGRFSKEMDPEAWAFNASIGVDQRLAAQDVRGSLAWVRGLIYARVLEPVEGDQIVEGLVQIGGEIEAGTFQVHPQDEDIHSAVERRLHELIGDTAGRLHTGRSRNDQVATDLRLWLLDHLPLLARRFADLQWTLIARAETDLDIIMPGYTHLQQAQPISLGHWWLAHFWPLQRDQERLRDLVRRTAVLPLGSGALAGTPFPIDRAALASELGFDRPSENSIDAVSDRDFVAEFLSLAALAGVHLSRLCEGVILNATREFGVFVLSEEYATGSSLMPQKLNPDIFELTRGKTGVLAGNAAGFLVTLKGLPSAYDKDLQEDKLPLFRSFDTLAAILPVLAGAIKSLTVDGDRAADLIDSGLMATDLADYLVRKGKPFRQAHTLAGKAVAAAYQQGVPLKDLGLEVYTALDGAFGPDVYMVFDPAESVARRSSFGGTAREAVLVQLEQARKAVGSLAAEGDKAANL